MTAAAASIARPTSPYKGLAPFEDSDLDALLFFGRERDREIICANLLAARLTILYGPSGVGKSSVLRAGVARDLRALPERPAVVVHDTWTTDPLEALDEAVAHAGGVQATGSVVDTIALAAAVRGEVYLVLDQIEEYFLYHAPDRGPGTFEATLAEIVGRPELAVHVLIGVREDALARLDAFKARIPGLFANSLRLDRLDRAAGRRAIVGPVARFGELVPEEEGLAIEDELVDAVLDGVTAGEVVQGAKGRGAVKRSAAVRIETPYLQLVMQRLWEVERAEGSRVLRASTLARLGGAAFIVEEHLERALGALTPRQKAMAARMFDHLVTPSGTKIAHGSTDLAQYAAASEQEVDPVIQALGRERILRTIRAGDGGAHEIYHDVLADAVLAWRARFEAEQALEQERADAERRQRRLLIVLSIALVALVVMTAIAFFAVQQRGEARDRARSASARELAARALTQLDVDPEQSLDSALQAARLEPGPGEESVLRRAQLGARLRRTVHVPSAVLTVGYSPDAKALLIGQRNGNAEIVPARGSRGAPLVLHGGPGPLAAASLDPSGARVLIGAGRQATVWDRATGRRIATIAHRGLVTDASFSPDGTQVASASLDGTVSISRARDGSPLAVLRTGPAWRAVFSPDGRTLAVVAADRTGHRRARLYRGARLVRVLPHVGISDVAFSPDGRRVATASRDGSTQVWDARTGKLLHLLDDGGGALTALAFSPDGALLATGSSDGAVRVWRLLTAGRFYYFTAHQGGVTDVAFDPTGTFLVSTSVDRTARVWQVAGVDQGTLVALLAGHRDTVETAAFSPDGSTLATAGLDRTARIWDARITQTLHVVGRQKATVDSATVEANGDLVTRSGGVVAVRRGGRLVASFPVGAGPVAISPAGLAAWAQGSSVRVARLPAGRVVSTLPLPGPPVALAFDADAGALVTADAGGRVVVRDPMAGRVVGRFRASPAPVRVALTPGAGVVATGAADGSVRLWSSDGKLLHVLRGHTLPVTDLRFDPTGTRLVSASEGASRNAMVWNVRTGRVSHALVGHFGTVTAASFSSDGRWIVTAGPISAGLWPTDTGRLLFYLRGPTDLLTDAEWTPGGYRVVAASRDGTVRTYDCTVCVPLDRLVALGAARLAAAR